MCLILFSTLISAWITELLLRWFFCSYITEEPFEMDEIHISYLEPNYFIVSARMPRRKATILTAITIARVTVN